MSSRPSAFVVGSGPNGLAAAVTLARAGVDVTVFEAEPTVGGGTRSAPLTAPGFVHDVCSAIHPLGVASPFFRSLPLTELGVDWIHPGAPLAHPLDDGTAVILERSLDATASALGADGPAYRRLFGPLVNDAVPLLDGLLAPLFPPRHPLAMARFGLHGLRSARGLALDHFAGARARALFAGIAGHSVIPLDAVGSAAFGLMLGVLGHTVGWPFPRGGSQTIADALARQLVAQGGRIETDHRVESAAELSAVDVVMFDVTPRQLLRIGGAQLPTGYRRRLTGYRYGPAAFKMDWALRAPIPWQAPDCARAATVHLGGTIDEIAASEQAAWSGEPAERPFVLLAQPSLFDPSRAPPGEHTAWAYCHVPNGSTVDMTARIEAQIERFAPGFGEVILHRHVTGPAGLERHNANYIGGDIVGGANDLRQQLARPVLSLDPYAVPVRGWYLCSSSTPPGGGVHGMCGYNAARSALRTMGWS